MGQEDTFTSWATFLSPQNEMEYSSICTTFEMQTSNFSRVFKSSGGLCGADSVSVEDARASLQDWIANLEDADGEPILVPEEVKDQILQDFDEHGQVERSSQDEDSGSFQTVSELYRR